MPQSKNSQKREYIQNKKMSRILVGAISFAYLAMGIYFALTQNYFGSALFLLLPIILITTLVKGSSRTQDDNVRPVSPRRSRGGGKKKGGED